MSEHNSDFTMSINKVDNGGSHHSEQHQLDVTKEWLNDEESEIETGEYQQQQLFNVEWKFYY